MLVYAAVCPHPPAMIPAVARGGAPALDDARRASLDAVRALWTAAPDVLVCVGAGPATRRWGADTAGSLRALGVDTAYGEGAFELPVPLIVARFLLNEVGTRGADIYQAVCPDASPEICEALGTELAEAGPRTAFLVMGDGSAKRSKVAPGYLDSRAADFDRAVVAALSEPSPGRLLSIDVALAHDLWVAGRPSWQVLAGALEVSAPMHGEVTYDDAPLGVGYFVVQMATLASAANQTASGVVAQADPVEGA